VKSLGNPDLVYRSVDELATVLGISRQSTYLGLRAGAIPSIRLGKRFILPKAAIQEWMSNPPMPNSCKECGR